jgi:ABC-type hemin transport system substrate-binding protein
VAEGFLKGDETYQKVVKTLDKQLKRTDLDEIADLDVQQHRDAVKKELENMSTVSTVEDAPKEIQERARQNAQRISAKQQKKKFLSFNRHDKPPKLVPRGQASAVNRVINISSFYQLSAQLLK